MATGFSFGATTTPSQTFGTGSITFGTPSNQPQAQTGISFSANPPSSVATSNLFGTQATGATNAPLFGTPSAPSLFGANTTTSAPNFAFAAPATPSAASLSFQTPNVTAAPVNLSFGLPTPAATTSALSFGLPGTAATTTATPTLGLGFGAPTTTSAPPFGNFGLGLSSAVTTAAGLGSSAATTSTIPASTSAAPTGLGGIATTQTKSTTVTTQKEVPPKDQPLPNEILQSVDTFKAMVKQQRNHSSDITRCSVKDFRRVEQEIGQLNGQINGIESQLQKNRQLAEKLKYDTANTVRNVEMAQRTHDTPPGLQYENTAPLRFFLDLADQFERDMQNLKMQIEAADKYVKNNKNPDSLTPQDLSMGMRRLHETFVALAGRLQAVHSQVESQKETYINIRKHLLQDVSDPFEKLTKVPEFQVSNIQSNLIRSPPKVATGPTPFNNLSFGNINSSSQQSISPPAYPGPGSNPSIGF
ncbi:nuclear pore complex protein Nup58-like isoform X2 [Sitophilus oryzae]|uniref:Nuclear pore complex protein Nup58-like isoform X2 n=1 Tax=Sitophilus oryzae TaxID=7048 RepID=A0A6J2Y397_SITOR|nr:nuclear pore complex protein Nup58-like isoform X2 [Sitophilus oryzae]